MNFPNSRKRQIFSLPWVLLLIVLLIAIALRFAELDVSPGWYSDEGTMLELARHLSNGNVEYLGINRSFLLAGRMPLFIVLLAVAVKLWGVKMLTLRMLTASLAVISTVLLYSLIWKQSKDTWWAFSVAFVYAVLPRIVFYQRLGFSYHLGGLLVLIGVNLLWLYWNDGKRKYALFATVVFGLATVSDLALLVFFLPLMIVMLLRRWQDAFWGGVLFMAPLVLYAIGMYIGVGEAFWYDWQFTWGRVAVSLPVQIATSVLNFTFLSLSDPWWELAWLGFLFIPDTRERGVHLLFWGLPWLGIARSVSIFDVGYYHQIPVFPLWAIGIGSLLRFGLPIAENRLRASMIALVTLIKSRRSTLDNFVTHLAVFVTALVIFALLLPLAIQPLAIFVGQQMARVIDLPVNKVLVDVNDAQRTVTYINQQVHPCDLVITSPALAWAIESRATGFQISQAFLHNPTRHFPSDIPRERFAYNVDYHMARYAIIDPVWRNWGMSIPSVEEMTQEIRSRWKLDRHIGSIVIYQNPTPPACP
ncbi:hypothetical protein D6779_10785 [Candidatus Parcubacteria bacterium]|nr:MAG: hypothetical protein D6779_10785 [Candidatus Parcubacteria bacterium]